MRKRKVELIHVVARGLYFSCDISVPSSRLSSFVRFVKKYADRIFINKNKDMTSLFEVATLELPNGFKLQVEQKVQFFWEDQYRLGFIEKIAPNFGECGWVKIKDYDWISNQVQIEKGVWKVGEVIKGNAKPVAPPTDNIEGF